MWESGSLPDALGTCPARPQVFDADYSAAAAAACHRRPCRRHEGKQVVYRYHVTPEGAPKRLWMQGQNMFSGAHFDHWCGTIGPPHSFRPPFLALSSLPLFSLSMQPAGPLAQPGAGW